MELRVDSPSLDSDQKSIIKGTVLENYSFDVRDFTESQLDAMYYACAVPGGNKILKLRLFSTINNQYYMKKKYLKRVGAARSDAYWKHIRHKNLSKIGVPDWAILKFETIGESVKNTVKSVIPSKFSIYTKDSMRWPDIIVHPEDVTKRHLVAGMPPECVELSGIDRLKQAFFPMQYMKYYNSANLTHTYNIDVLLYGTLVSAMVGGGFQAWQHARTSLKAHKRDAGAGLHETRRDVFRTREQVWIRSFGKYTFRWGWRIGFLFATTTFISQALTIYKLQDKMHHYVFAAGCATALYKWKLGLAGMAKTGLVGAAIIGVPIGFLFATLGCNPKTIYYFSRIEPKVVGPLSEAAMSPEHYFLSHARMLAIMDMMKTEPCDELNNTKFYREFTGVDG